MDPKQRFRRDHPCPVCGGHEGLPQGEGRRCYGFMSIDGLYSHCTREDYASNLEQNTNSNTFAHYLNGECECGLVHDLGPAKARTTPGGSQGPPSVHSYRHPKLGRPSQLWPYQYADGELACYVARFDKPDGGKTFRPLVLENGSWRTKSIPEPRPLYNLPALLARTEDTILVVEGEKTTDAAEKLVSSYVPITSMNGSKSPQLTDWSPLKDRDVVVLRDNDSGGLQYAEDVTNLVLKVGPSRLRIVQLPDGIPAKWDLADPIPDGVDVDKLLADAEPVALKREEPDAKVEKGRRGQSLSAGDRLLEIAYEESDLYCDGEETYADVRIGGHRETLPVRSTEFERWLRRLFHGRTGKGATKEALTHAMLNLDAQAVRAGHRSVYLRTATHEGKIYISLCDDARRVVELDSEDWRILNDPPEVRFRRTRTAIPLPEPVGGDPRENIRVLRRFLNVEERDFVLCVACLLAALRDTGPYPLLVLTGEQGSAKSTAAKLLRSLVDPARPPTRGMPGSERDAAIAARNRHVLVFDNLSGLPPWFSDTLCRLSTGEGYATRALYTDYEEAVIEASRPVILNGIENPSVRGDLAERSITIRLAPIAAEARLTESALMTAFEEAAPIILGSLLTGLSEGLRTYDDVRIKQLPRMADFCKWAVACDTAYWRPGTFMEAYNDAQASATEDVLEDSPIGPALRQFLEGRPSFEGTATELLNSLSAPNPDEKRPRGWPSTGAVMGKQLTRLAPSLRKLGYTAEFKRASRGNLWSLESPRQSD